MSRLIAVWSPCSGAGVTALATGLACALAEAEGSAVVADLNLPEPGVALGLDLFRDRDPMQTCLSHLLPFLEGERLSPHQLRDRMFAPPPAPKVRVLAGPCHPLMFPRVTRAQVEHLLGALAKLDQPVVLDLNPTLDFVSTWPALATADHVLWVTGADYTARYHARRTLAQAQALGLTGERVLHVFCQTQPRSAEQMTEELGVLPAAVMPHLPDMASDWEAGKLPWSHGRPGRSYWQALLQLVVRLRGKGGETLAQR